MFICSLMSGSVPGRIAVVQMNVRNECSLKWTGVSKSHISTCMSYNITITHLNAHFSMKENTQRVIRRKLCTGRPPTVNRVVARKATDWSKFWKRCETGKSIGLYSVPECTRKFLMIAVNWWYLVQKSFIVFIYYFS